MEHINKYGIFGLAIALIGFTILFVQNTLDSKLIQDSVNHNLIYSYELKNIDKSEAQLVFHFKNNGIKSVEGIRIKVQSRTNNIKAFELTDTVKYEITSIDSLKVFKEITIQNIGKLYPTEDQSLLLRIYKKNIISGEIDLNVSVNNEFTNGILVENALIDNEINYNNIELYLKGSHALLISVFMRLILPFFLITCVLIIFYNVFKKNKYIEVLKKYLK